MGAWLGPVGGLERVRCASELDEQHDASVTGEVTALDGTTSLMVSPVPPNRTWQVKVGTSEPEHMNVLAGLERATRRGLAPLVFYTEDALVANILDPAAAAMDPERWSGLRPGGASVLPLDGTVVPRHLESGTTDPDGTHAVLDGIPVPHGVEVAVSVYVAAHFGATARVWVEERALDGHPLGARVMSTASGVIERLAVTFTTSPETVALRLRVADAVTVTMPAVTLTSRPMPWVEGQGCLNAVITALPAKSVQLAFEVANDWGRRNAYQWSVREIGRWGLTNQGWNPIR